MYVGLFKERSLKSRLYVFVFLFRFIVPFYNLWKLRMEKENKIIFGRSKTFFPLDYPLQYMEMLLSNLLHYISFKQIFLQFLCLFQDEIYHLPISFLRGRSTKQLHGYRCRAPWFWRWDHREGKWSWGDVWVSRMQGQKPNAYRYVGLNWGGHYNQLRQHSNKVCAVSAVAVGLWHVSTIWNNTWNQLYANCRT